MLSQILRDHQARQATLRKENDQLRAQASQSIKVLSSAMTANAQVKTSQLVRNQKELDKEAADLAVQVAKYTQQTKQWLQSVHLFNDALKELGDVQSWATTIERDMLEIAATLEFVHQGLEGCEETNGAAP
ncbi:hypothetical protein IWQ60_005066 [Tieghemiomyces parasiticus]|uniref:Biogenesis of lysosome-related organelles complex 1 subunit 1 n=1 Tax=Tieghemiomyces parasiticus TaxID=78921 RepID=A0A9W8A7M5_9FUNG|nr:hypothetical protein IWQ60_005066 [Tieghemiomyces parasiticus]